MEECLRRFCKSVGWFCNHLESSCDALKQSVDRRAIPLDSASSTFIQCLNRRVSSASTELNLLDAMSFETVSFEELLGHCNEAYKKNQSDLLDLQDRLKSFGYVPASELDEDDIEVPGLSTPLGLSLKHSEDGLEPQTSCFRAAAAANSVTKCCEEDPLLDESLSLQNLGLSDVCLATLASQAHAKTDHPNISLQEPAKSYMGKTIPDDGPSQPASKTLDVAEEVEADLKKVDAPVPLIKVSKDDYESLPSYIKSLASWEDLLGAIGKINSGLNKKNKTKGYNYFHQDEVASLDLGPKGRAYLLLLMRMNRFAVETIDGLISYRVL